MIRLSGDWTFRQEIETLTNLIFINENNFFLKFAKKKSIDFPYIKRRENFLEINKSKVSNDISHNLNLSNSLKKNQIKAILGLQ